MSYDIAECVNWHYSVNDLFYTEHAKINYSVMLIYVAYGIKLIWCTQIKKILFQAFED